MYVTLLPTPLCTPSVRVCLCVLHAHYPTSSSSSSIILVLHSTCRDTVQQLCCSCIKLMSSPGAHPTLSSCFSLFPLPSCAWFMWHALLIFLTLLLGPPVDQWQQPEQPITCRPRPLPARLPVRPPACLLQLRIYITYTPCKRASSLFDCARFASHCKPQTVAQ